MPPNIFLEKFLIKSTFGNLNTLFKESKRKARNFQGLYRPLPIISRAFLLLRVSTVFVNDSLQYAGYNSINLDFWWKNLGVKHGLWEDGNEPANTVDLWSDVDLLINTVKSYLSSNHKEFTGDYHKNISLNIIDARKFQKVYLWGIGI